MENKLIYHIDVNSAFLSWEADYRIHHLGGTVDLRNEIAAVGGDMAARHGIILAKSILAKKYGIRTGDTIVEARQKCPDLIIVPPNYSLYERCSKAFVDILKNYTPTVEQYSIDECFLDMSATQELWGDPITAATHIKNQIRDNLGFTVNIGISNNKLLAKMASDFKKPDRVHILYPDEIRKKMWPLPVSDLFYVGRATLKKLINLGIYTIGDLAKTDPEILKKHFKRHGEVIWAFANGIDASIVEAAPPPNKGYGNSTTIAFDVDNEEEASLVLLALAETVAARLREAQVRAEVIAVGIKTNDFRYYSHQMVLENATNITQEIHKYAVILFREMWDGTPIRHLGIHTSRLSDGIDIRQLNIFDQTDYEKLMKLDSAVDRIRHRYGNDSIKRAVFLMGNRIDHMSGGISREKRSVDYSKIKVD